MGLAKAGKQGRVKAQEEPCRVMEKFCVLIMVVTQPYPFVQTHQTVLKRGTFYFYILCLYTLKNKKELGKRAMTENQ